MWIYHRKDALLPYGVMQQDRWQWSLESHLGFSCDKMELLAGRTRVDSSLGKGDVRQGMNMNAVESFPVLICMYRKNTKWVVSRKIWAQALFLTKVGYPYCSHVVSLLGKMVVLFFSLCPLKFGDKVCLCFRVLTVAESLCGRETSNNHKGELLSFTQLGIWSHRQRAF